MSAGQRWALLVYDPDDGYGDGCVVGPFFERETAEAKGEQIERAASARTYAATAEYVVLPVFPGAKGANAIVDGLSS